MNIHSSQTVECSNVCSRFYIYVGTLLKFLLIWLLQVKLLKDILEAWKAEVEKKPPTMSLEEAYTVLKLPKGANGWVEMGQWVGRDGPVGG